MNRNAKGLGWWTRTDKVIAIMWAVMVLGIAILPVLGFPGDTWRIGWGVVTMAWGCYLVVRELQSRRYVYAILDLWGIALTYWIFFVLFQWHSGKRVRPAG